jgi:hypothetical protein
MISDAAFYRRLQGAGILSAAGLAVQLTTLFWSHPLAFVIFILLGGTLVGIGVLLYLFSIVSR